MNVYDSVISDVVVKYLGQGTFATVFECFDTHRQKFVAVKVLRSDSRVRSDGIQEIELLNSLPPTSRICNLLKSFECFQRGRNHLFLVFEVMHCSILHEIEMQGSLPIGDVRKVMHELLTSLKGVYSGFPFSQLFSMVFNGFQWFLSNQKSTPNASSTRTSSLRT